MRNTRSALLAGLLLATFAVPSFGAPIVEELMPLGFAAADGGNNTTGGGGNNTTVCPLQVLLSGPAILLGSNGTWQVTVSYGAPVGNNTTGATHSVLLSAALQGVDGTATVSPHHLDVAEGGLGHAQATVTIPAVTLPTHATLVVYASTTECSAQGSASFFVV